MHARSKYITYNRYSLLKIAKRIHVNHPPYMSNIYNGDRSLQAVASDCPLSFTNENNRIANVYFYFVLEIDFFELN